MFTVLALAAGVLSASDGVKFEKLTFDKALHEAAKSQRLVFVDFATEW